MGPHLPSYVVAEHNNQRWIGHVYILQQYEICAYSFIKPYTLTHQFYWLITLFHDITTIEMTIHLLTEAKLSWKALHTCKPPDCSSNQEHENTRKLGMRTTFNHSVFRWYWDQSHHSHYGQDQVQRRELGRPMSSTWSVAWLRWSPGLLLNSALFPLHHPVGFLSPTDALSSLPCKRRGRWKRKGKELGISVLPAPRQEVEQSNWVWEVSFKMLMNHQALNET